MGDAHCSSEREGEREREREKEKKLTAICFQAAAHVLTELALNGTSLIPKVLIDTTTLAKVRVLASQLDAAEREEKGDGGERHDRSGACHGHTHDEL